MSRRPSSVFLALLLATVSGWSADLRAQTISGVSPADHRVINLVFIGDSITQGAGTADRATQAAPIICARELASLLPGGATVYLSNQGHSGHTTEDFQPGGADLAGVENAARELVAAHPEGRLIFSIMLGTNDSANSGTNGAPISAERYRQNLQRILDALTQAHPACLIFLHRPIWYSFNTHNNSDYEGPAPERLKSYFPILDALATSDRAGVVRRLHPGDTGGYEHFASAHLDELAPENGKHGVFYLHPNAKGAEALGKLWAQAIAEVLSH